MATQTIAEPKTVKGEGSVATWNGVKLDKKITFEFEYVELQDVSQIPQDEQPKPKDILALVNGKRYASARASAQNDAVTAAGLEKPTLQDENVALQTMRRVFRAQMPAGTSDDVIETLAKNALKMTGK